MWSLPAGAPWDWTRGLLVCVSVVLVTKLFLGKNTLKSPSSFNKDRPAVKKDRKPCIQCSKESQGHSSHSTQWLVQNVCIQAVVCMLQNLGQQCKSFPELKTGEWSLLWKCRLNICCTWSTFLLGIVKANFHVESILTVLCITWDASHSALP